jgi:hypothetical protein
VIEKIEPTVDDVCGTVSRLQPGLDRKTRFHDIEPDPGTRLNFFMALGNCAQKKRASSVLYGNGPLSGNPQSRRRGAS